MDTVRSPEYREKTIYRHKQIKDFHFIHDVHAVYRNKKKPRVCFYPASSNFKLCMRVANALKICDKYAGCPSFRGINVSTFQNINLVMTYS